jgi:hypothetical protein
MMKYGWLIFLITWCLIGATQERSIAEKKLQFFTELGGGFSIAPPNTFWDQHSAVTSINYPKGGLGILYNRSKKWTGFVGLSYSASIIQQRIFFDGLVSSEDIRLKHVVHDGSLNVLFFRTLVLDSKSALKLGLGGGLMRALNSQSKSNQKKITGGTEEFDSFITAYRSNRLGTSINLSLLYLVALKKSSLGFRLNLDLRNAPLTDYIFEAENWFKYAGKYGTTGPYLDFSLIYTF